MGGGVGGVYDGILGGVYDGGVYDGLVGVVDEPKLPLGRFGNRDDELLDDGKFDEGVCGVEGPRGGIELAEASELPVVLAGSFHI